MVEVNMQQIASGVSVAERLAEKLKGSDFGQLMDEDALGKIAKDAIERAFFQDRPSEDRYSNVRRAPLIVQIATEQFTDEIKKLMKPIVEEIAKSQEFQDALVKAAILQIPQAVQNLSYGMVATAFQNSAHDSNDVLANALGLKLQAMRNSGKFG
jgi:hypothetical protein